MKGSEPFRYFAFISYSSKDTEWGRRLQRKLEHYRMPAALCNEHGWERTPIKPVFFAPTDIQPGGLTEELQERLRASRNLIVICSPNSAQSEWVGKEIEFFHQLGRAKQIHFFIIDGQPNSDNPTNECFNPIIKALGLPEMLGANIHERTQTFPFTNTSWPWMDEQRAYVQLISTLLGIEFDAIWQRHKRLLIQKMIAWAVGIVLMIAAIASVWITSQPFDVEVRLNEASIHNDHLPPLQDAVVTMKLDNETKTDTIRSLDESSLFTNIPHRYLDNEVRVRVECSEFLPVDTILSLSKSVTIHLRRNPAVYGNLRYKLWNPDTEQTSPKTEIVIDGHRVTSDADGMVGLVIPLADQKTLYPISSSSIVLMDSMVSGICGPNEVILFKRK